MRIIAGTMRGRRLNAPKGLQTRPTTDRVRESLFSALTSLSGGSLAGMTIFDPFAGSGALGLEALSRGAAWAVFAEKDRRALDALASNIAALEVSDRATICRGDVLSLAAKGVFTRPFSLILLDAPYTLDPAKVAGLLGDLASARMVTQGALSSWEHARGTQVAWPTGFEVLKHKRYGSTEIEFAIFDEKAGESQ